MQVSYEKLSPAQVLHLQSQVDRELFLLELHKIERVSEGASSRASKAIKGRHDKGRELVKDLVLNWDY